jgi:hypothetical protein
MGALSSLLVSNASADVKNISSLSVRSKVLRPLVIQPKPWCTRSATEFSGASNIAFAFTLKVSRAVMVRMEDVMR